MDQQISMNPNFNVTANVGVMMSVTLLFYKDSSKNVLLFFVMNQIASGTMCSQINWDNVQEKRLQARNDIQSR